MKLSTVVPLIDFDPAVGTYNSDDVLTSLRNTGLLNVPFSVTRPSAPIIKEGCIRQYVKGNPAWQVTTSLGSSLKFDLRPGIDQPFEANLYGELWNGDRGISTFVVATEYDPTITNPRYVYSGWSEFGAFTFPLSCFSTPSSKALLGAPLASVGITMQHPIAPIGSTYIASGSFAAETFGNSIFYKVEGEYTNESGFFTTGFFNNTFPRTVINRPVGMLIGNNFGANNILNFYPGLILRMFITPWLDRGRRLKVVEELKQIYF